MSAIYDNWERLVAAVLKKELLWQLFHEQSRSPSTCSLSSSSDFSFSRLSTSLDDVPFGFSSPDWSDEQFGAKTAAVAHSRRRDLTIQVPKPGIEDHGFSRGPVCSEHCSKLSPTVSPSVNRDDVKQESYPLPLPPTAISNASHVSPPKSAAKLPSPPPRSPKEAENVKSPGISWKKGKLISKSPLGDVYLGFNSEKGQMCVMKEVSLSTKDTISKQDAKFLEKEIALFSGINHPNIVQYYGSETVADNFYIYFEFVSGGSVNMILQQYGRLGESVISNYTQQILSGLAYLHSKGIAHRDVKGASVLVDPNGKVKLCNFAFEKQIAEQYRMSWFMDSFYWMAPEVIMNSNERTIAVDIWSLGCTVLEMATTRPPLSQYDRGVAMFKIANHKELPQFPDHLSDVCKDFLRHCLQWNPRQRSTASQLLDHPFVKNSVSLGKQILVSTSSAHPTATNAAKSEGTDHERSLQQSDSGKVISHTSKASNSNFQTSDIYTPRNKYGPVSPVGSPLPHPRSAPLSPAGSPLPHPMSSPVSPLPQPMSSPVSPIESPLPRPRSPQHLNRLMPPPPKSSPCIAPKPMISGVEAIPLSSVNQSQLRQKSTYNSSKINSPSYWDPIILRGVFKFS